MVMSLLTYWQASHHQLSNIPTPYSIFWKKWKSVAFSAKQSVRMCGTPKNLVQLFCMYPFIGKYNRKIISSLAIISKPYQSSQPGPQRGPTQNKLQQKRVQCRVLPKGMLNIIQTFYMLFRGLKQNALSKNHFYCNLFQVQLCTDWTIWAYTIFMHRFNNHYDIILLKIWARIEVFREGICCHIFLNCCRN